MGEGLFKDLEMLSIFVISMGGTIERSWDVGADETTYPEQSKVPALLGKILPSVEFRHSEIHLGESNLIDELHLEALVQLLEKDQSSYVLITHGSNSVKATFDYLIQNVSEWGKPDRKLCIVCSSYPIDLEDGMVKQAFLYATSLLVGQQYRMSAVLDTTTLFTLGWHKEVAPE